MSYLSQERMKDELKLRLTDYVNLITTPDRKAGKNKYKCPLCGSGNHGTIKSDGAFSITNDGLHWTCFSCQEEGDIFSLIGKMEKIKDFNKQLERAAEIFNVKMPASQNATQKKIEEDPQEAQMKQEIKSGLYKDYILQCKADVNKTDYYYSRAFNDETIEAFNLGYDDNKKSIVIPYDGSFSYYITRSIQDKQFRKPKTEEAGPEPIFNKQAIYNKQPCFICESQICAISIIQAGGNAAAIGGAGATKLIEAVKEKKPQAPLILSLDNDDPGENTRRRIAEELLNLNIPFVNAEFNLDNYTGKKKDPNDLLVNNENQFKMDIAAIEKKARRKTPVISYNVKEYISKGIFDNDINYFKEYKDRKTGFSNIDRHLTLYPGLAALGGTASLGKTTFAVNLADNLLKAGETILYFSLEQEPIEIITKSIARKLYERNPFSLIKNLDIKNGATSQDLEEVKNQYSEAAERFNIIRCNFNITAEEIKAYTEEFISTTGKKPIVFIDYLQLISPPAKFKGDTRTTMDHILKTLKIMQVENELLVILISSLNRTNYSMPIGYEAFKESGMIEFTCDYIWGLQLAILDDNEKVTREEITKANTENPKRIEFVSLKSRNGKQSYKCFFNYNMEFDVFIPEGTEQKQATFYELTEEEARLHSFDNVPIV